MTKKEMLWNVEENARKRFICFSNPIKELKYRKALLDAEELALYEGIDGNEIDDARRRGYMRSWKH